jgi:CBS domain-containing protein
MTFGSEGRLEQTFKTDQDNALILADGVGEEYFERFAEFCQRALELCGYPACPGGYMASNPQWRRTAGDWKARFSRWVEGATVRDAQEAIIFLDMRPLGGDAELFGELDAHVRGLLKGSGEFLSLLAFVSLNMRPPVGFFRRLVVERSGEHKDQLDLKMAGTGPIVNVARIFTLEAGGRATNTEDRLRFLIANGVGEVAVWKDLQEAFEFLMMLRLHYGNYVAPHSLTHLQRTLLKEAFQAAAKGQALMEEKFRNAIWPQLQAQGI